MLLGIGFVFIFTCPSACRGLVRLHSHVPHVPVSDISLTVSQMPSILSGLLSSPHLVSFRRIVLRFVLSCGALRAVGCLTPMVIRFTEGPCQAGSMNELCAVVSRKGIGGPVPQGIRKLKRMVHNFRPHLSSLLFRKLSFPLVLPSSHPSLNPNLSFRRLAFRTSAPCARFHCICLIRLSHLSK